MNKLLQHIINAGDVDHRVLPGLQKARKQFNAQKNPYLVFAQEGVEYKGPSIVDYLATKGYSGKKQFRKDLADKYGIEGYDFSAAKNTELLNKLRESDELLRQYDQTMAPIPVERMMEMEQQARAARQAAAQRPVNPAPVYNFSPEFQNMRIPQTKINTSLQPKVIYDGKFSLKPKMVIPMPFGFNKTTPASEVPNSEITDPVRNVPSRPKLNLPQYNPFARPEARPELGPFISERYNDVQEVDIPTEQETPEFLFNSQKLFNSFNRPEQKPLLPVVLPAKKPVVKTEKYTKPEAEELPWYEEAANAVTSTLKGFYDDFAESVNNSPYDFRQVNFGTGMSADGAKEMTREVTRKGLGLFSPDLAEKYNNWLNRQQAIQNMDKDPVSKIVVPDFDYAPMYITGDTIPDSERQYHLAESMDLNALKFGVRNRGDLTPLDTEAASITAFHPFVDAKSYFTQTTDDPANATYLGITPDGQVQIGGRKDVENKDVKITRVFSNKVVDFVRDPTGGIKKVPAGAKVNKNAFSPAVTVIGDDGKQKEGKLNLVVPQGSKADDAFGVATGGRFLFQTPDGQFRLVSGSLNNIEQEFKRFKGNNPYVTVVSLDNGSFSRGLRTKDQKLTAQDLRSYDNLNTGGGNFAYLLPNQQTSRPLAKFDEFEKEATKRLQALYPGKKVSVEYQDTGLYNQLGGRDIQTQADIQKKGNSQTGVSLHNFNAARDYVLYVDGKPINGDEKNKAGNDIYKEVLWKAADKTGVYHIDPWDVGHIGLAKEGQKTAFDELKAKYPEIFTDPNFVKSLEFINKNKNNPNYQEYYELLNNIQKFTGAPRTTEFMKRSGTAKKAYGGPVDLPKAQWGSFVNPTTIAGMAIIAEKAKEFFGFNEPKIVRTPTSAPKRLSIRDPRKVMMTSGKPLRPNSDLVSGDYDSEDLGNLLTEAKRRKMSYNDMMNLAAMGFQETKWGKTDPNIGHTMGIFGDDPNPDPYENFINAYDAKMKDADRLKIKDEATRLQVYNGLGKVFPSTEADYHGFKMKKIYGVEVPKGGIDLRKNPLYGKQVIDIRDNVLKRNPEFMRYMDSTYRAPRPIPKEEDFANGGLFKMQKAGQNNLPQKVSINDPRYAELYKNRQVGSFYDDAFSLPDLDEVTVSAPRSYSMKSLRDFTNASLYGAPVNTMKIAAVPQAAMTEGVEMLRGKPYSFSNVNPNLGSFGSNQRDLSMTMGYENPQGFLQNAANVGLSMIDPSIIAGGSALLRQPIQRAVRSAFRNSLVIGPQSLDNVAKTAKPRINWGEEYFKKIQNKDKELQELVFSKKITDKEYSSALKSYEEDLRKELGLGKELGRGNYGSVYELADEPSKVIKVGNPMTFGSANASKWTPELIENLKSVRQNANISIPENVDYYEIPSVWKGYGPTTKEVLTMPNLNKVSAQNLNLNKRDRYALFLKQARQLRDKGIKLDVDNPKNFQFNKDKGVFDIYDVNPGSINDPNFYMQYVRNKTKGPLFEDMRFKQGGHILDPRGQWAHPGKVTRIPSPNITMQGVPYPVFGVGSNGQKQMMYPGQEYNFGGASYVDEYPMMRNGGGLLSKSVTCSNCGWSWKASDGGLNPLTCHKCGGTVKMQLGGLLQPITAQDMGNVLSLFSVPQKVITKAVTGKYQTPSEAMDIKNPYGAFAVDAVLDPVNLVGAGLLGKMAQASTKTGLLSNTYKINPWRFKPKEGMMYRGLGQEGLDDALQSGVLRPKQYNFPEKRSLIERVESPKQFGTTYYAPAKKFDVVSNYGDGYIAEVPFDGNLFSRRYGRKDWSWSTPKQISIEEANLLEKDWLKGYKPVKLPNKKTGGQHGGLDRWFAEKWVDVKTGKDCGRQEGEKRAGYPACRPSKRVSSETPKTSSEMSSAEKAKFKANKTSSQRINYNHKRNK